MKLRLMNKAQRTKETFYIKRELDVARTISLTQIFLKDHNFDLTTGSMIATAVSELAMNIVKYADRGYITIALISQAGVEGMEVIAEDHGPGIGNPVLAMSDSGSTGGTLGLGLPGVKRLMDEFLMDSAEDLGTKIVTRKWKRGYGAF